MENGNGKWGKGDILWGESGDMICIVVIVRIEKRGEQAAFVDGEGERS